MNCARSTIFVAGLLLILLSSCSSASADLHNGPSVTLSAFPEAVNPAADVLVTVKAAVKRVPAAAMQWVLRYDDNLLSPVTFTVTPKSAAAKKTISCTTQKEETRCILWGSNTNPIPDGGIAEVRFRLHGRLRTQKALITLDHPEAVSGQGEALAVAPTSSTVEIAISENTRTKSGNRPEREQ